VTQRFDLDEVIDPFEARVLVSRDSDGEVVQARFDLSAVPRIEPLLVGRPVVEVPPLVERLCGICPVPHHLAGVRALEALSGSVEVPAFAQALRRLLHYGSVASIHATRHIGSDHDDAVTVREFAKAAMAAAGSPSHFPKTAVVGGVASSIVEAQYVSSLAQLESAKAAILRIVGRVFARDSQPGTFNGADVALVDSDGNIDFLGERLRAVAADGAVVIEGATAQNWDELIIEAIPGDPAPRPYLAALGSKAGGYRVGPVAQLRVGKLPTPMAAKFQQEWLQVGGDALAARAVILLHCIEAIGDLLESDVIQGGDVPLKSRVGLELADGHPELSGTGIGVGWVDGARGLLVHRYVAAADGSMQDATILTPTAQNEYWLCELLRTAANSKAEDVYPLLEEAIREADPCLPCVLAPVGKMGLLVQTQTPVGGE
jgi:NAD-reducing hydrogenase large subunit